MLDVVFKPVGGAPRLVRVGRLEDLLGVPLDAFVLDDEPELSVVYNPSPEYRRSPANCKFRDTPVFGPVAIAGRRGSRFVSVPADRRSRAFAVLSQNDSNGGADASLVLAVREEAVGEYVARLAAALPHLRPESVAGDGFRAGWSALAIHTKELVDDMMEGEMPPDQVLGHIYIALLILSESQLPG